VNGESSASAVPYGSAVTAEGHRATPVWVTPDAVELDVDVATVGSRGIAYLLDLSVVLGALLLIQLAQLLFGGGGFVEGWFAIAVLLIAAFVVQFGYPIGFEVLWRGRTLGKAAMGLRVVTIEGAPVGFRHATIRAVAGLLELLPTLGMIAIVSSFSSSRGQRLGDLAAGTVVIRERHTGLEVRSMVYPVPVGWDGYYRQLDVTTLGSEDRAVIRDALRRADRLAPRVRSEVMEEVGAAIVDRVAPPPPPGIDAETWLRCVAARIAARGDAARIAARGDAARIAARGDAARIAARPPAPPGPSTSSASEETPPPRG
jgi:uncharacterized RDD family membrane protein YckC